MYITDTELTYDNYLEINEDIKVTLPAPEYIQGTCNCKSCNSTERCVNLVWSSVSGASLYEIWKFSMNSMTSRYKFTKIAEVKGNNFNEYQDDDIRGNGYIFYYIVAKNDNEVSPPSKMIIIDIQ